MKALSNLANGASPVRALNSKVGFAFILLI